MAERVEDLNLPAATMARIIKDCLPDHVSVGKDARAAISKAAVVFILYLTGAASEQAQQAKRKVLQAQDILNAIEHLEFDEFTAPLLNLLEKFKQSKSKKAATKGKKTAEEEEEEEEETIEGDDTMEED